MFNIQNHIPNIVKFAMNIWIFMLGVSKKQYKWFAGFRVFVEQIVVFFKK